MKKLLLFVCFYVSCFCCSAQVKKIDYVLHLRTENVAGATPWYSAVIRNIDPAKDDYKAYCRYLVSEVGRKVGGPNFVLYIYDNAKAYNRYEVDFLQHRKMLGPEARAYIHRHAVGAYDENNIVYFEDCDDPAIKKFKGHEHYRP